MNNCSFRFKISGYLFSKSRTKRGGIASKRGSALISVLISSAIGLIVIHGVTKSLVQSKINQLILEKKDQRRGVKEYLNKIFSDYGACLKTLEGENLSGSASDAERSFKIPAVKDSSGNILLDFTQDAAGALTHEATKTRLQNFGIDQVTGMKFIYRPAEATLGRIVLQTKTKIKDFHEKQNADIAWELAGLKVEAVSGPPAGDQVTACRDSNFLKTLCGVGVGGGPHENGGGFVQDTAIADKSAYVGSGAVVCGIAQVKGNAYISGGVQIRGRAVFEGGRAVGSDIIIEGSAVVILV